MSWGYGVGFLLVVLGRQQLFTENTLTVVLPLLTSRGGEQWKTLGRVARVWGVVLAANLAGAFLFAWVVHTGAVFDATTRDAFVELGTRSLHPFAETFVNGLFAGWLIALMVWLLPAAETARVWVILVITYVVGLGQFAHVVVGSLSGFTAVLAGAMSWGQFVGTFFLPTLLGNVIGGTALVAALNHAQVIRGREPKPLVH
jgi:formate/nitrite transporter FocA (FNT family)